MSPGEIIIAVDARTAFVTISNPARRNAISIAMWRRLIEFAGDVRECREIRAILISGAGKSAFSAGADIGDFEALRYDAATSQNYDDLIEQACCAVETIPQPSLALIKGACIGAGASLAASCDLRLAERDAFFAVPAARLGLGYDRRGIARFLRVFGSSATQSLLYTGGRLPASRAYELGALHAIAPAGQGDAAARTILQQLSANAPLTLRAAKLAIRALATDDSKLLHEADRLAAAADASADYAEGQRAFTEKRAPNFTGS